MHACFIFLLTLAIYGVDQTSVRIEVGVPGADFYVDGNFVHQTDAHGNLQMGDFPPGAFRFAVKKDGYLTYHGSFYLAEGESKTIHVLLLRPPPPSKKAESSLLNHQAGPTVTPLGNNRTLASSKEEAARPLKQAPEEIAVAARPRVIPTTEGNSSAAVWAIPLGLAVLLFLGLIIRQQIARRTPTEPSIEQVPVVAEPAWSAEPKIKHVPEFIEKLKRQEELVKAGFATVKHSDDVTINKREKETVIVLPKDAYTSEEEK